MSNDIIEIFNSGAGDGIFDMPSMSVKKTSPDTAIISQLDDLIAHSVVLAHTNPLASGAIDTPTLNVVGQGLKLQSIISYEYLGIKKKAALKMQRKLENIFNLIANSKSLDVMGQRTFSQLQSIAYKTMKMTGGCIVLYPEVEGVIKIKLLEAQHLSNKDDKPNNNRVAGGVEIDKYGRVSKFHLLKIHPSSYVTKRTKKWMVIPTKTGFRTNAVHLYEQKRAGQRRGIPSLAAVLDVFRKLNDYSEAELDAALLNARFAGFVWNENPPPPPEFDENNNLKEPDTSSSIEIKKGNLIKLEQGWKVSFADPARPNANYQTFLEAQLQVLCIGLNIPTEVFMKHFKASYSASRGAIIEGRKYFLEQRKSLASEFCQTTYENVILRLVLDGKLTLPGFLTDPLARLAWLSSEWIGDAQEELDPLKAAKARQVNIKEGLTTRDREAKSTNGSNYTRNVEVAEDETKRLNKSGLPNIGQKDVK